MHPYDHPGPGSLSVCICVFVCLFVCVHGQKCNDARSGSSDFLKKSHKLSLAKCKACDDFCFFFSSTRKAERASVHPDSKEKVPKLTSNSNNSAQHKRYIPQEETA